MMWSRICDTPIGIENSHKIECDRESNVGDHVELNLVEWARQVGKTEGFKSMDGWLTTTRVSGVEEIDQL